MMPLDEHHFFSEYILYQSMFSFFFTLIKLFKKLDINCVTNIHLFFYSFFKAFIALKKKKRIISHNILSITVSYNILASYSEIYIYLFRSKLIFLYISINLYLYIFLSLIFEPALGLGCAVYYVTDCMILAAHRTPQFSS